jgi:glycoprotein-N-acetylgalactosamine 3-beta-galactosyltransferase
MRRFLLGFSFAFAVMSLILEAYRHTVHVGSPLATPTNVGRLSIQEEQAFSKNEIRLFCWVPIAATGIEQLVSLIHATWGRHCSYLLFTSEFDDPSKNIKGLGIKFTRPTDLWNIIHPAWQHAYEHHLEAYEWFIKVDSDSYFSADNFRYLASKYHPDGIHYLGHTAYFKGHRNEFNLGAGYAISRGALRRLGPYLPLTQSSVSTVNKCASWHSWAEDFMFSECLRISGNLQMTESKDSHGRETFMAFKPLDNMIMVRRTNSTGWFWKRKPANTKFGVECCSSRPILFHQLKLDEACHDQANCMGMVRALEYFLYSVAVDPALRTVLA